VGRLLSSLGRSTNSIGMAVARPVTRVLPTSLVADLAEVLPSLPIAATNRRCDITGIELMVAFHGFRFFIATVRQLFSLPERLLAPQQFPAPVARHLRAEYSDNWPLAPLFV